VSQFPERILCEVATSARVRLGFARPIEEAAVLQPAVACEIKEALPTEAALFASQLLFDVVIYSLGKGALRLEDGIAPV
jgi:hypothetical protein